MPPIIKYCQKLLNRSCFSSLVSSFSSINHNKADNDISLRIKLSLQSEVGNRIDFANAILKKGEKNKGGPRVYYSLVKYKQEISYDILKYISKMLP